MVEKPCFAPSLSKNKLKLIKKNDNENDNKKQFDYFTRIGMQCNR
jgi:hypothetical protein